MADPSPLESPDTSGIEISRANLIAQQQRLMSLLDERSKPNPLEFFSTLAGAAANSGNYGTQTLASLGAGAGLANRQQQEKELTGAQMRMEIANSQDQMARERASLQMVAKVFGTSPQQFSTQLSSGDLPSNFISKVTPELMVAVSINNPKLAEQLRHAYTMGVERVKLVQKDVDAGVTRADLIAKYGPGVLNYLPKQPLPTTSATSQEGSATSAPASVVDTTQSISKMTGSFQEVMGSLLTIEDPVIRQDAINAYFRQRDAEIGNAKPQAQSQQPAAQAPRPTVQSQQTQQVSDPEIKKIIDDPELPIAEKNKLIAELYKKRFENADAPWQEKVVTIQRYDPALTTQSMAELQELAKISTGENRNVLGFLQESGWFNATAQAVVKGATAGNYNIAIPGIEAFVGNLKFTAKARQDLERASQILGSQFLANVKANKGLLGINPTDNDARLLAAPMANVGQTADSVLYWTKQQANQVLAYEKMYKSYNDYIKKVGRTSDPSGYFTNADTGYTAILKDWRSNYDTLSNNAPWRK